MNKNRKKILYILIALLIVYIIYNIQYNYKEHFVDSVPLDNVLDTLNIKFKKEGDKIVAFNDQPAIVDQEIPEEDKPLIMIDVIPSNIPSYAVNNIGTILPGESFYITVEPKQTKYKARISSDSDDSYILFSNFFDIKLPTGFKITKLTKNKTKLFYRFDISTEKNTELTMLEFKVKKGAFIYDSVPNRNYKESPESYKTEFVIGFKINRTVKLPGSNNVYNAKRNTEYEINYELPDNIKNKYIIQEYAGIFNIYGSNNTTTYDREATLSFKTTFYKLNDLKTALIIKTKPLKKGTFKIVLSGSGIIAVDKNNKNNKTGCYTELFTIKVT
jgi:hypothetical protein